MRITSHLQEQHLNDSLGTSHPTVLENIEIPFVDIKGSSITVGAMLFHRTKQTGSFYITIVSTILKSIC